MKSCCIKCFTDRFLQNIIADIDIRGDCDFCGAKNALIYPLGDRAGTQEIEDQLAELIGLYEITTTAKEGRDLSQALLQDWDIFHYSSPDTVDQLLHELYPASKFKVSPLPEGHVTLKVADRDAILGGHNWDEFSDDLKHTNRFFVPYLNVDGFVDFLKTAVREYSKSDSFYRARISETAQGFKKGCMSAPPRRLSLPGRINPQGIRELYLAEDKETALREVRAGAYDYVTFGEFHSYSTIRVVDLSAFSKISPFEYDVDLAVFAANRDLLQGMSKEVSHIMRRGDDSIEYIPTQFIAEFIKSRGYHGVRYNSTLSEGGTNICIFDPKKFHCVAVNTEAIKSVNYEYDSLY